MFLEELLNDLESAVQPLAAQVLIDDTFNRGSVGTPANLGNSTPTTTATGDNWISNPGAGSSATTNGSGLILVTAGDGGQDATVEVASALSPTATYVLTVNMPNFVPNGGDSWISVGMNNRQGGGPGSSIGGIFMRNPGRGSWTYNDGTGIDNSGDLKDQAAVDSASGTEFTITLNMATGVENSTSAP